jgi:hypothetical protein
MLVILCMVFNSIKSIAVKVWVLEVALRLNRNKRFIRGTL